MTDYDDASISYDNTRTYSDVVIDRFCRMAPISQAACVLDFGCGTGNYLRRMRERFGCRCYGIEPSDGMRARAHAKHADIMVVKGDHGSIPFAGGIFDFCYMTDVIHHIPDLDLMFRGLHRVMRPGGSLCVVTESHAQIEARFYNRYFPSLAENEKRRYPDVDEIVVSAQSCGFVFTKSESIPPAHAGTISGQFLRNVEEKNYSMFRMLSEEEFAAGLEAMKRDHGRSFESPEAGETLVWFSKINQYA